MGGEGRVEVVERVGRWEVFGEDGGIEDGGVVDCEESGWVGEG